MLHEFYVEGFFVLDSKDLDKEDGDAYKAVIKKINGGKSSNLTLARVTPIDEAEEKGRLDEL